MKLVMTLLVRDEENILETNLRYHLSQGVDFIIAMDHRSVDGTPDILKRYEKMGYLRMIRESGEGYEQDRWVTRMARMAYWAYGADWVINCDADEFWWPKEGDLKAALGRVPDSHRVLRVDSKRFFVESGNENPGIENMLIRVGDNFEYVNRGHNDRKSCHRGMRNVVVGMGNHVIRGPKNLMVCKDTKLIEIFHYTIRDYASFENRVVKGTQALESDPKVQKSTGTHWRMQYEIYKKGKLREHYDSMRLRAAKRDAGLENSRFARDTSLRDYLRNLDPGFPRPRSRSQRAIAKYRRWG